MNEFRTTKSKPTQKGIVSVTDPRVNPLGWRVLVPCCMPSLVALFAPMDVLTQSTFLQWFVTIIVSKLPFIVRPAMATAYPEVWLLAKCLMISIILPTAIWYTWRLHVAVQKSWCESDPPIDNGLTVKQHVAMTFGVPLVLLLLFVDVGLAGDPFFAQGFTTHNRGGLAFMTLLGTWFSTFVIAGQYANVRLFIRFHLRGKEL